MLQLLEILTVIDKEYLLNIKKRDEQRVIKRFFIVYSLFFLSSCLLVLFTNFVGFLLFLFFPFLCILHPYPKDEGLDYEKWGYILLANKYFKLSILFTIIFFSLMMFIYLL